MGEREALAATFRRFADVECRVNDSPLYAQLSYAVAENPVLLDLAAVARAGQPPPNLLFAAVQYLLAAEPDDVLAAYYPALGGARAPDSGSGAALAAFCARRRQEIMAILRARMVQTNEVRRSALLRPAFWHASEEGTRPLALIEIGPSAGLNLLFDRYRYDYGDGQLCGPKDSPVTLESRSIGDAPPLGPIKVASRAGIDLNPLDVRDADDVRWLRALIWPEHNDRRALLDAAVSVAREHPPRLVGGDIFALLPSLVREAPAGADVCIFATMVLNQFTPEMRQRLRDVLLQLSTERPLHFVVMGYSEFAGRRSPHDGDVEVVLIRVAEELGQVCIIARANPHGRWIDYRASEAWSPWEPEPTAAVP